MGSPQSLIAAAVVYSLATASFAQTPAAAAPAKAASK